MQIGFSKKVSENLLEDIFEIILKNIIKHKKVKISKFGTFSLIKKNQREMLFSLKHQRNLRII